MGVKDANPRPSASCPVENHLPGNLLYIDEATSNLVPIESLEQLNKILDMSADNRIQYGNAGRMLQCAPIQQVVHYTTLGEYLRHLYEKDYLMDVLIYVDQSTFKAHRVALSCFSGYFADLFNNKTIKRVPNEVKITGISGKAFAAFLEYVYTGQITVDPNLTTDLLILSEHLYAESFKRKLRPFDELPLPEAVKLLLKSKTKIYNKLRTQSMARVLSQFVPSSSVPGFLEIDVETFCTMLSSDDINVSREYDVFLVALRWIKHGAQERSKHIIRVMSLIRFCYMSSEELFTCVTETEMFRSMSKLKDLALIANWIIACMKMKRTDPFEFPASKPRKSYSVNESGRTTDANVKILPARRSPVTSPRPSESKLEPTMTRPSNTADNQNLLGNQTETKYRGVVNKMHSTSKEPMTADDFPPTPQPSPACSFQKIEDIKQVLQPHFKSVFSRRNDNTGVKPKADGINCTADMNIESNLNDTDSKPFLFASPEVCQTYSSARNHQETRSGAISPVSLKSEHIRKSPVHFTPVVVQNQMHSTEIAKPVSVQVEEALRHIQPPVPKPPSKPPLSQGRVKPVSLQITGTAFTSAGRRTPKTSPHRTPQTSPCRTPRTSPRRTPQTSPRRTPRTSPKFAKKLFVALAENDTKSYIPASHKPTFTQRFAKPILLPPENSDYIIVNKTPSPKPVCVTSYAKPVVSPQIEIASLQNPKNAFISERTSPVSADFKPTVSPRHTYTVFKTKFKEVPSPKPVFSPRFAKPVLLPQTVHDSLRSSENYADEGRTSPVSDEQKPTFSHKHAKPVLILPTERPVSPTPILNLGLQDTFTRYFDNGEYQQDSKPVFFQNDVIINYATAQQNVMKPEFFTMPRETRTESAIMSPPDSEPEFPSPPSPMPPAGSDEEIDSLYKTGFAATPRTKTFELFVVGEFRANRCASSEPRVFDEEACLSSKSMVPEILRSEVKTADGNISWIQFCNIPAPRRYFEVVLVSKKLYLLGGCNPFISRSKALQTVFRLDLCNKKWSMVAPMQSARMNHCACALNDKIYVFGGLDHKNRPLSTIECYNIATNSWMYLPMMPTPRYAAAAASFGNECYVVGGLTKVADDKAEMLSSTMSFDPRTNEWKPRGFLHMPLCYASLVNVSGRLMVCSGATCGDMAENSDHVINVQGGANILDPALRSASCIDEYNPADDSWNHVTTLRFPRHGAGATAVDRRIYLFGGVNSSTGHFLRSIECFDTGIPGWLDKNGRLPNPAGWIKCVASQKTC